MDVNVGIHSYEEGNGHGDGSEPNATLLFCEALLHLNIYKVSDISNQAMNLQFP